MRSSIFTLSLLIASSLCAVPAVAQEQEGSACGPYTPESICDISFNRTDRNDLPLPISVIDVVANALPRPISDPVYPSITLTPENGQRIENLLRETPGLQQFRRSDARSANPTSQGITLRGLGGNASSRALLFLDGVPQADPFGGWIAWPGYDALPINTARVTRGGGGPAGSGAIAGIVELESARIGNRIEAGLAYGSRDSVDADLLVGRELGAGQLTISANYARSDGFTPIITGQRGSIDRPADYEQAGLAVRYVAPLADDVELQANIRGFTDDRERGFAFSDNHNDGADASIRLVNRSPGGWQWSALGYVQIRNFDVSFGGVSADRNSVNRVFEQFNVPSTGLGTRIEVRPPLGNEIELRLGGDWRRTEGITNENFFFADNDTPRRQRRAGGETSTYGAFAEASVKASDALTLTGGARIDFWTISDGFRREIELISPFPGAERNDNRFASRDGTEFTARGGLAFDATDELTLRAAGYLGWRLPTLNELFRPFRVGPDATAANELLRPEQVRGGEVGLDWYTDNFDVRVTAFYSELEDAVTNVTLDRGPGLFPGVGFVSGAGVFRQRQNVDAVTSKGIEIETNFDLATLVPGLYFNAAYAYIDAEVDASGAAIALNGLRPAQIPRHNAAAGLEWRQQNGTGAGISLRYIGSQFEDDLNQRRLDDALTVDARLGLAVSDQLLVEARVENLFDARVETAISSSNIIERAFPQTFWIGLRAKIE